MFFLFLDPEDAPVFGQGLERLEAALDVLREIDPKMTVTGAATLIHVARRLPAIYGSSITLGDVAKEMKLNYSTFMRTADVLSEGSPNTRALGLLENGISPDNKNARKLRLTDDGLALLRRLDSVVLDGRDPAQGDATKSKSVE